MNRKLTKFEILLIGIAHWNGFIPKLIGCYSVVADEEGVIQW